MSKLLLPVLLITLSTFAACAQKKDPKLDAVKFAGPENKKSTMENKKDTATLANGCFWCTEAIFQDIKGVETVISGYTDGNTKNPTYEEVSSGNTGFAEALQIVYDPSVVSFDELLEIFWKTHDPTTLNRQGNDVGTQYRSGVYYHDENQKEKAEYYKTSLDKSGAFDNPIVTEIKPFNEFYAAEDYHQSYFNNNENKNPYCKIVIRPKVDKFRIAFKDKLKK
ncbi:peptide-methionine (S)-S-oxide reductase MsrA [Niabella ginsengisoli]|uniref:Peptide methionine sulfoxide reductase MsrA n=1 Tax=Niabella ginsengisoli TaxID=522298 RepID=A0ABS9SHN5_9BACT|nr:peptide-methionine (S)-S-oxide reductase MsrA [Niabella ginsengisoli]MCH5597878.1 peptide-methionine (S)-S-oxide reductase MsrA [Niabella ginsengisoli]